MEMGGEPVAYIDMKPDGVRQCKVGENVKDRFKVVNIDVEARSVEITIVGHKVKLSI
jgi:VCBS repeat-containing protein